MVHRREDGRPHGDAPCALGIWKAIVYLGFKPNEEGSAFCTSAMARRINTYIARQELPDKAADTPAYTCQALHEESFEIHTCLHIARAKLCPTNTHMSKAFDPLQSTASVQSKSRSETLDRENAKLSCFLDSAEMCSRRTSSTRCVE